MRYEIECVARLRHARPQWLVCDPIYIFACVYWPPREKSSKDSPGYTDGTATTSLAYKAWAVAMCPNKQLLSPTNIRLGEQKQLDSRRGSTDRNLPAHKPPQVR